MVLKNEMKNVIFEVKRTENLNIFVQKIVKKKNFVRIIGLMSEKIVQNVLKT